MKKKKSKNLLIALIIAIVVLAIVVGISFWYQSYKNVQFDTLTMIIIDIIGFLAVFGISYRFIRGPKVEEKEDTWGIK